MADSRCFVQFSHPGGEHAPDHGRERAWHKLKHGHRDIPHMRKFMQLRGQWIDENGNRRAGALQAWGEWEPESEVVARLNPPDGDPRHPRYLWRPFYVPKKDYRGLHNTDPFIFGAGFLYSNCRQCNKSGPTSLTRLDRGSVIAFGSGKTVNGEKGWMLDTVLVVRDFADYAVANVRVALKDWVPATFMDVTGGPLADNAGGCPEDLSTSRSCAPTGERFRLYRGATPDDPVDGMFSFFPASPARDASGFPRPLIHLPSEYFNPASWRGPNGLRRHRTLDELRGVWEQLLAQVHEVGLVPGTHAELPERR